MSLDDWLRFCKVEQGDEDVVHCTAAFEGALADAAPPPLSAPPADLAAIAGEHFAFASWSVVFTDADADGAPSPTRRQVQSPRSPSDLPAISRRSPGDLL